VEMVDTPDLGSGALWVWRFESFPRYIKIEPLFSSWVRVFLYLLINGQLFI